jgi:hypothetical protein
MKDKTRDGFRDARATLQRGHNVLHKAVLKLVRRDKVCRQFMAAPGVGQIVSITYKTAVDDRTGSRNRRGAVRYLNNRARPT